MLEVVCGVVADGRGAVLACRRPPGKHLAGLWEFPGGKVDPGESPRAALARELHEELGVRVEVGQKLAPVVWDYGDVVIRLSPFVCTILSGEPHPHEHDAIRWSAPAEWESLQWAPADLPILDELRTRAALRRVDSGGCPDTVTDP